MCRNPKYQQTTIFFFVLPGSRSNRRNARHWELCRPQTPGALPYWFQCRRWPHRGIARSSLRTLPNHCRHPPELGFRYSGIWCYWRQCRHESIGRSAHAVGRRWVFLPVDTTDPSSTSHPSWRRGVKWGGEGGGGKWAKRDHEGAWNRQRVLFWWIARDI